MRIVNNIEIHEDYLVVSVNPRIFQLDVVYAAAAFFMKDCYVQIRGDVEEEIVVELRPKTMQSMELVGRDFGNRLVVGLLAKFESAKGNQLMEEVIKKAVQKRQDALYVGKSWPEKPFEPVQVPKPAETQPPNESQPQQVVQESQKAEKEPSYLDDPYGIAKPWEETHGNQ
ncbi:MAG: hypothetical protein ABIG95_06720 [Candidatus Woesearchaeota archaeon]